MSSNVINIVGIDYEVKEIEDLMNKFGMLGQASLDKAIIEIDSGLSETKKQQTLVHEVLHACFNEAGYGANEQDEDMINRVGIVLYQVLKDNPNFIYMLTVNHLDVDEQKERLNRAVNVSFSMDGKRPGHWTPIIQCNGTLLEEKDHEILEEFVVDKVVEGMMDNGYTLVCKRDPWSELLAKRVPIRFDDE